jgi:cytidylate kinase
MGVKMKKNIMIAISGRSGCGNTTISNMVAETLGLKTINFTFRSLAAERNIDLKKVLELAQDDDSWDKEIDTRQVKLALESNGCVLGSRLAVWMLKDADLKIYLEASAQTRVERIIEREGGNPQEVALFTEERDRQDHARYLKIYNIETENYSFVDMIIDTDKINAQQIADLIVARAGEIV